MSLPAGLQAEQLALRRRELLVGQLALRVHRGELAEPVDTIAAVPLQIL